MGILFITPNWLAPSELWMERMIEAIESHVVLIATNSPYESLWHNRVPIIALQDRPAKKLRRILNSVWWRFPLKPSATAKEVLMKAVEHKDVSEVFVHYLEYALRFSDVWNRSTKKLFVHCHGYDVTWDLRRHERPDERYFADDYVPHVRQLAERALLIANSQTTMKLLTDIGVPRDRIRVKYLGVLVPKECPFHINQEHTVEILYLGRLVDFKGPDLVIRAFELACERGLDANLTIAGDGEMKVTCELMKRRSKVGHRIALVGAVDERSGCMLRTRADIFTAHNCVGLMSRQQECFGVSIVEAMAAALPVVTGRSGSVKETVVDGETGMLVTPGDVEGHAEAFLRLAGDGALRKRMGEAGWRRAGELFSTRREEERLLQILELT